MIKPVVSVIINCLNGEKYVKEAIDSVYAQSYKDWEIIFWDNASTDNTAAIAKGYDEHLRYFRSDRTYTLGKARNLAFEQAKGEYIAILDADDIWLPQKLERQLTLFDKNPALGLVFSNSIFFDEAGDRYSMFNLFQPHRGEAFNRLLAQNFISTETMIYRKSALKSMDYIFDDEFTMVMDYDISLRIAYHYEIDYIPESLSKWRMHKESESSKRRFLIPQENFKMIEKMTKNLPEIRRKFSKEIGIFKKNVSYEYALSEWSAGDKTAAKNHLKPYVLSDLKSMIAFLLVNTISYSQFNDLKLRLKNMPACLKKK